METQPLPEATAEVEIVVGDKPHTVKLHPRESGGFVGSMSGTETLVEGDTEEQCIANASAYLATLTTESPKNPLDGYVEVGSVSFEQEAAKITFDDLKPVCAIDKDNANISVTLDRVAYESPHGTVHLRLIGDFGGRAFLFRKDFAEEGLTRFKVAFSHQAA